MHGTGFEDLWEEGMLMAGRGDVELLDEGDGSGVGYLCEVKSRTHPDARHKVQNALRKGWTCECPMYEKGRKICAHIVASFVYLSAGPAEKSEWEQGAAPACLEPPPDRWCAHCGSTDCVEKESRQLRRMPKSDDRGRDNSSTICLCNTCGRTFADRPGFSGRHYSAGIILRVLTYIARGMTPADASRTVNDEFDTKVSEKSCQRWVDDYQNLISAYADGLTIADATAVSVDEKCYTTDGKKRWMYKAICIRSRFVIAVQHSGDKLGYDATDFFEQIVRRLGKAPLLWINDRLNGFMTGYKNVLKTDPPSTLYIPDAALKGVHVNNNIHERSNGSVAQCIARARGFHSDEPGLLGFHIQYRNFIQPHYGLDGMTPAEKIGIKIPGPNKLLTLIRCAVASKFKFS